MSSSEKNNQIAVDFFDSAWNKGDFSVLDRLLAPKAIDHSPLGSEEGAEGFKGIISSFRAGMPNLVMTIADEIYSGDRVVHSWVIKGTHTGDRLMGVPATNKELTLSGVTIVRIENDIIQERWTNLDMLGLLTQLGVVPPMGGPPAEKDSDPLTSNKALVSEYIKDILIGGKFDVISKYTLPDFVIERSALPADIKGGDALKNQMTMLGEAFPDMKIIVADMIAEDDKVLVRFEGPGTHLGEFVGIPPTNRKVVWKGLVLYKLTNGKIEHAWANWDDAGLIQQLQ